MSTNLCDRYLPSLESAPDSVRSAVANTTHFLTYTIAPTTATLTPAPDRRDLMFRPNAGCHVACQRINNADEAYLLRESVGGQGINCLHLKLDNMGLSDADKATLTSLGSDHWFEVIDHVSTGQLNIIAVKLDDSNSEIASVGMTLKNAQVLAEYTRDDTLEFFTVTNLVLTVKD